ncbi:MAG: peptidoglycan-binding domain-containing protein [Aureispira sp.]
MNTKEAAALALEKAKQNKTMTAVIAAVILATLVYFFRDKIFTKNAVEKDEYIQTSPSTTSQPSRSSSSNSGENNMLSKGSSGSDVKELQGLLNHKQRTTIPDKNSPLVLLHGAMQGSLLTEDGQFGAKTEQALYRWTNLTSITLAQARKALA